MKDAILKVVMAIGVILGIASTFLLIQQGYELGLSTPFKTVFSYYDACVRLVAGFLEPVLDGLLALLKVAFDWDMRVRPGWHHVFVAIVGIVSANVRLANVSNDKDARYGAVFIAGPFLILFLAIVLVPADNEFASRSVDFIGRNFAVGFCALYLFLGAFSLWESHVEDREKRSQAYAMLAIPIGVLFFPHHKCRS